MATQHRAGRAMQDMQNKAEMSACGRIQSANGKRCREKERKGWEVEILDVIVYLRTSASESALAPSSHASSSPLYQRGLGTDSKTTGVEAQNGTMVFKTKLWSLCSTCTLEVAFNLRGFILHLSSLLSMSNVCISRAKMLSP